MRRSEGLEGVDFFIVLFIAIIQELVNIDLRLFILIDFLLLLLIQILNLHLRLSLYLYNF